jgi:coenzyme F420 hydrogenase subunit beta
MKRKNWRSVAADLTPRLMQRSVCRLSSNPARDSQTKNLNVATANQVPGHELSGDGSRPRQLRSGAGLRLHAREHYSMSRLHAVLNSNLCSGCGLCASVLGPSRARMTLKDDGFLRPEISGAISDAEDAVIATACPGSRVRLQEGDISTASPEWGPIRLAATGHATDAALRQRASSGGAISAVLQHLLSTGQAAYVLQVAASREVPWLNTLVRSDDAASVFRASGSRYAPSAPLEQIIACLDEGHPFVFVGKPCDVSALRAYADHDVRVDKLVVAIIAFMCAGVPSAGGVKHLVRSMGAEPDDVQAFQFRGDGWPGRAKATTRSGSEFSLSYNDAWGAILSKHVQQRCKICADGAAMSADIVCADAWYGDASGYPIFEEKAGRSLILARTAKGEALIASAVHTGGLAIEAIDAREIDKMQPFQLRRTRLVWSRLLAMRLARRMVPHYDNTALKRFSQRAGKLENFRSFAGTLKRLMFRRF